jgi:alpha-galactosidase
LAKSFHPAAFHFFQESEVYMKKPDIEGAIEYRYAGKTERIRFGAETGERKPDVLLRTSLTENKNGIKLTLTVEAEKEIVIKKLSFRANDSVLRGDRAFLNGYQSWTDTKEFTKSDRMKKPSRLFAPLTAKFMVNRYADYEFRKYSRVRGDLHGASYGWLRASGDTVRFFGSTDERSGFTFFYANLNKKTLTAVKDCENLHLSGRQTLFSVLFSEGTIDEVMDAYFSEMKIKPRPAAPATGWTSWYNYYQNISEEIILDNLEAYKEEKIPVDIFQIDDGYQTAVGDWLSVNERFPNGMKPVADSIREAGFKPGIWLAPFAGETVSMLFRDHPEWFIADEDGKPFCTGGNWSQFYSLDLYNENARAYIRHVFDVVLNEWGFELVKLDFLYGVCIKPRRNKTRAQIMCEAMDFLRECVGEKLIIGCGVPLWPAFGAVEYCRIGTDIDLQWHKELYSRIIHREFPSTRYAVQNSIFRSHLDGRAFVNDPDVFLLRHTNISLSPEQRRTVFYINNLFGNLLFTSDNIREYTEEEQAMYRSSFPLSAKKIHAFSFDREFYTASFSIGALDYVLVSNNGKKERTFPVPGEKNGELFFRAGTKQEWFAPGTVLTIPPFAAECLLACRPEKPWSILGSTGSAFPGSEIRTVSAEGKRLAVTTTDNLPYDTLLYVSVPAGTEAVTFGESSISVSHRTIEGTELYFAEIEIASALKTRCF